MIDTTQPSREFDAWIAENVMGCSVVWDTELDEPMCACARSWGIAPHEQAHSYEEGILARYTTDIAAAWEVVEKMANTHKVRIYVQEEALYRVSVYIHEETYGHLIGSGSTSVNAPLAICQAAYAAITKADIGK